MTEIQRLFRVEDFAGRLAPYPVTKVGEIFRTEVPSVAWIVSADRLDEDTVDDVIQGEIEHFRALGVGFEWTVTSFDPPFLRSRLEAAGFNIGPREVTVCAPVARAVPSPGHLVEEVRSATHLDDFCHVCSVGFGKDFSPSTMALRAEIDAGRRTHLGFVAYTPSGQPAAAGRVVRHPDGIFAGLYSGCTLPEFRRSGYYQATVYARMAAARELGDRYAFVDALPTSLPHLLKMGFEPVCDLWPAMWRA